MLVQYDVVKSHLSRMAKPETGMLDASWARRGRADALAR